MQSLLYDLLLERGIDPQAYPAVTLMRHADKRYPLFKYIGTKALTLYQALQKYKHEPGGLIVSFYGHKPDQGLLLGIWRVVRVMPAPEAIRLGLLEGGFEKLLPDQPGYYHELEDTGQLSDLRLRLELQSWGGRPNSWRRVLKRSSAYPVALSERPPVPFQGAQSASLVMAELRIAVRNLAWQQGLGAVPGIYLITDEKTGRHYVGSAGGGLGILQRWTDYAVSGHGGNLELMELLRAEGRGRENEFRFTVLETLPASTPRTALILRESYWKVALGARTFGLNRN